MRFFIIPKKMFKIKRQEEKSKHTANKKKLWILLVSAGAVLVIFMCLMIYAENRVPSKSYAEGVGEYALLADTKEQREAFFEQFGYTATEVYEQEITIPCDSEEFEEYNKLQKSQGLDLYPYCGRSAVMYTMQIEDNELFGVIIVYKGKVVAGHLTDNLYPAVVMPLNGG